MKKSTLLAPYMLLGLFFVGLVVWWTRPTRGGTKVERLMHAALSLPIGSTKQQVALMLQKEGFSRQSNYTSGQNMYSDADPFVHESGLNFKSLSGYYCVYVHDSSKALIGQCSTYFYFFFDKKGKLVKHVAQKRCIGL